MLSWLLFVCIAFGAVVHALMGLVSTRPFILSAKFHLPIRLQHTNYFTSDQHEDSRSFKLKYFGDGNNGNIHEHGKLMYPNGDVYEGSVVDDKRHGQGVLTYADGKTLQGEFIEGRIYNGAGVLKHLDGNVEEGTFVCQRRASRTGYSDVCRRKDTCR